MGIDRREKRGGVLTFLNIDDKPRVFTNILKRMLRLFLFLLILFFGGLFSRRLRFQEAIFLVTSGCARVSLSCAAFYLFIYSVRDEPIWRLRSCSLKLGGYYLFPTYIIKTSISTRRKGAYL